MAIITKYGIQGRGDTVESYGRMRNDGLPVGGINSDYRDPVSQIALFKDNYTSNYSASAKYNKKTWNGVSYWRRHARLSNGATTVSVAVPGSSNHEKGTAVDFASAQQKWLKVHGAKHGWFNPDWAKDVATFEPWHWEYDPAKDKMKDEDMGYSTWTDAEKKALAKDVANAVMLFEVPQTNMSLRINTDALGEPFKTAVVFRDVAAYAQALAFRADKNKDKIGSTGSSLTAAQIQAIVEKGVAAGVAAAMSEITGKITFEEK